MYEWGVDCQKCKTLFSEEGAAVENHVTDGILNTLKEKKKM
jgi:hypothetical protein